MALQGDWTPFNSEVQFKLAELLYLHAEVSGVCCEHQYTPGALG